MKFMLSGALVCDVCGEASDSLHLPVRVSGRGLHVDTPARFPRGWVYVHDGCVPYPDSLPTKVVDGCDPHFLCPVHAKGRGL